MNDFPLLILVFVIVGPGIAVLTEFLNRKINAMHKQAHALIRENLKNISRKQSVEEYLTQNIAEENLDQAKFLLHKMASVLKIPVENLIFDTKLGEAFSAHVESEQKIMERIEPFAYDIFYVLEKCIGNRHRDRMAQLKKEFGEGDFEEQMIDFCMTMTMKEFLSFFSPMIKVPNSRKSGN